jgi:hypothetical protein
MALQVPEQAEEAKSRFGPLRCSRFEIPHRHDRPTCCLVPAAASTRKPSPGSEAHSCGLTVAKVRNAASLAVAVRSGVFLLPLCLAFRKNLFASASSDRASGGACGAGYGRLLEHSLDGRDTPDASSHWSPSVLAHHLNDRH